jgi:hypothetical protein
MSSKPQMPHSKYQVAVGAAVLAIVATVYLLTFQTDICSNPSEYVIDSGEYQIALSLWGTVHHTGAPTYSLLGAAFVSLLRLIGVAPAAGAALFSVVCALVALGFIYALGVHLTRNPWAASAAVLALALGPSFWINHVIAELRAFGSMLLAASLWLAVCYNETHSTKLLYALAFVWGQALVHHRLAILAAPALAILVLPALLSSGRRVPQLLAGSVGIGSLAFAFYLYMPLRARMGAWTYGDPGTWQGFWFIFWAREVPFLMVPPSTLAKLLDNIRIVLAQLVYEWTAPGLIAIGLALLVAISWRKTRQFGWALAAWVAAFMVYLFILPEAVSPEKVLLWVSLVLALALVILVARLWEAHVWAGALGAVALVALAGVSGFTHRQDVLALTRDPHGREIITLLKAEMPVGQVANLSNSPEPTFMVLWGGDYFAAVYGSRVTGELKGFRVVDHRADFKQIVDSGSRLITLPSTFVERPKSWWRQQIGGAYLSSAGLGLVEIGATPPLTLTDVPPGTPVELGDGIRLVAHSIKLASGDLRVTLYWQASQVPSQNYSVFLHLSDKDRISAGEDIIAQADSQNPVYGWYPTTKWSAGEIVREDYELDIPPNKVPRLLDVGLYTRDADGAFHNLGVVSLRLD